MTGLLQEMAAASAARCRQAALREPLPEVRRRAAATAPPPPLRRDRSGFDLTAEVKLASPSAGRLAAGGVDAAPTAARLARCYVEAGAAAVSVLTEPHRFAGDLGHLSAASAAIDRPVLRKDFLVDPYQVFEARAAGAGGVLLILRMLDRTQLDEMLAAAAEAGLFVLLESFGSTDLVRANEIAARPTGPELLLGLNCRDLSDLTVRFSRFETLAGLFSPAALRVAESGVATTDEAARVAAAGYQMALVGTVLMRADDPAALVRDLLAAGRTAREG